MDKAATWVFVGAGISLPTPASLPLFATVRASLIEALGIELSDAVSSIAPETLMYYLAAGGVPLQSMIRDIFGKGRPNAVHYALASALRNGSIVWTTNVDLLIEQALAEDVNSIPVSYGKNTELLGNPRLVKIHGSLQLPSSLSFATDNVLRPLSPAFADLMKRSTESRAGFIAGYAGIDPDIRPVLFDAISWSDSTTWFELHSAVDSLRYRYRPLITSGKLQVVASANPSLALFNALVQQGHNPHVAPQLVDALSSFPQQKIDVTAFPLHAAHFAAGQLLELLGRGRRALVRYRMGWRRGAFKQRAKCLVRFYSGGLYYLQPWARPLRRFVEWSARNNVPWRRKALSVHARLLEREGDFKNSLRVAEERLAVGKPAPDELLDVCAAARKAGAISRALELSEVAANNFMRGLGDLQGKWVARSLYERAYALRIGGSWREAFQVASQLREGIDIYGGPNWKAWSLCQYGCVLTQATTRFEEALISLSEAIKIFESIGAREKMQAVYSNICTTHRAAGNYNDATAALAESESIRNTLAYKSVFEGEVIQFEKAELLRAGGFHDEAKSIYEQIVKATGTPIHDCLAKLGRLCCEERPARAQLSAISDQAKSLHFKIGISYTLMLEIHFGYISPGEGLLAIDRLDVFDSARLASIKVASLGWATGLCYPS